MSNFNMIMISIEMYVISAAGYKMNYKNIIFTTERPDKKVISVVEISEDCGLDKNVVKKYDRNDGLT